MRQLEDVGPVLSQSSSLIARGNGRAYGDASLNPDNTLCMGGCDRFREFDLERGIVDCESGMLLSDLLDSVLPRGWFPPVVPGTKFVTIGGLIAADVHGKNHHRDGSFGNHVESLRLAMADGTVKTCSRTENAEVFEATLGGMGLTGVILSARFRLRPIASDAIDETVIRANSLDALLRLFGERDTATYSVAWIDCLAKGDKFGRGVLMLGEHAAASGVTEKRAGYSNGMGLSVPIELPISPLNTFTIKTFNELYFQFQKPKTRRRHYSGFFFPLDAVQNWNRIYGKRGFVQYQCVIGGSQSEDALRRILMLVAELGSGSFLAVLKKLGPGNRYMSFPVEGYTITLDFPARPEVLRGLARLDAVVAEHNGRIYLAKDARAPRDLIEQGYPDIDAFRKLRATIDPERKFRSALSERLGL
jgi:FAD/FMN-containing dehydrogenase